MERESQNCRVHCKVINRNTVPSSMQEHCMGCEQEYSTQLVHRNIAQVMSRSIVPSWYAGMLHRL